MHNHSDPLGIAGLWEVRDEAHQAGFGGSRFGGVDRRRAVVAQ
jgi:hypothetical protein